jgi:acyl-CoA oxidase
MSGAVYENPDLKRERSQCLFDKEEITNLIDGGKEKTKERRDLGKYLI